MKVNAYSTARAFSLCACIAICAVISFAAAPAPAPQQQPAAQSQDKKEKKDEGLKVSEGEEKLARKLNAAPDAAAKMAVAEELLKKYPKTELRAQMISYLPGEINKVQDAAQRTALAEKFLALFPEPAAADQVNPILLNAYLVGNRIEDAFRLAGPWLEKNPSDVGALINLTNAGLRKVQTEKNTNFVAKSREYGVKAIELIEADKRPALMEEAVWNANKAAWLAQLYQSVGFLALVSGDKAEGLARVQKAITLNPSDPNNYAIVGQLKNDDYLQIAAQYKAATGAEQDALLKKAFAALDEIIDLYAHAVALSEGNAQMQQFHDTLFRDLESYYRSRHNGSTDGLQQLIDKYKATPKP